MDKKIFQKIVLFSENHFFRAEFLPQPILRGKRSSGQKKDESAGKLIAK